MTLPPECVILLNQPWYSIIMMGKAISYNLKNNVTFRNFNKCTPNTSNYKTLLDYLKFKDTSNNNCKKIIKWILYA